MKPERRNFLIFAVGLLGLSTAALGFILHDFSAEYREYSNLAAAKILGAAQEAAPGLDPVSLVEALRNPYSDPETLAAGRGTLEAYGLMPDDFASPIPERLVVRLSLVSFLLVLTIILAAAGYYLYAERRLRRKIRGLVDYLQELNRKVYDLRLDDNDESDFSLLTNELYKITVTLKEAAEASYRSNKHLEAALADISHQLRTPLTSIQVLTDNMRDDLDMPAATRRDFLVAISRQIDTMSSLVTTLLYLAKFDNGSIKLEPEKINIGDFLRHIMDDLAVLAELSEVEFSLAGDLDAEVSLDPYWQSQALMNILKNAIEHSPTGAKVSLQVENCPLFLRIKVRDRGPGMSAHDLKHIFERFYKVTNSRPEGVGIGLAFAKTIIEAGSGQISVKSEPNQGTTFTITYFFS